MARWENRRKKKIRAKTRKGKINKKEGKENKIIDQVRLREGNGIKRKKKKQWMGKLMGLNRARKCDNKGKEKKGKESGERGNNTWCVFPYQAVRKHRINAITIIEMLTLTLAWLNA